jgi:hypothetical protein
MGAPAEPRASTALRETHLPTAATAVRAETGSPPPHPEALAVMAATVVAAERSATAVTEATVATVATGVPEVTAVTAQQQGSST